MRPALRFPPLARGLLLALVLAGPAAAQSPSWVDPPARSGSEAPAPSPSAPRSSAQNPSSPSAPAAGTAPAASGRGARTADAPPADGPAADGPASRESRAAGPVRPRTRTIRRAERPRPAFRAGSPRPADTSAAGPAPADARFPGWAGTAQALADDYLDAVSGPGDTLAASAPRFYGSHVRFHGRTMTLSALVAEKRRFSRRWPQRRYEPRGMRTACNAALAVCVVRTVVEFRAASPSRGAVSQGLAELVLEVSFAGPRPVVVSESSRVLRRGAQAALAAGRAGA